MNNNPFPSDHFSPALPTRISLVGRIRDQQNEFAWTEFVQCYRKFLYNYLIRTGFKHHDADEIVQISLVKIWNAMPDFDYQPDKGRFRAWLCTITGNTARNYIRNRKNHEEKTDFSIDDSDISNKELAMLAIPPEVEQIAETEWLQYLPELALKRVKHHFDKRTLQVFLLCSKGITTEEIARRLQISPGSVYVYKARVTEKVAAEIVRLKKEFL